MVRVCFYFVIAISTFLSRFISYIFKVILKLAGRISNLLRYLCTAISTGTFLVSMQIGMMSPSNLAVLVFLLDVCNVLPRLYIHFPIIAYILFGALLTHSNVHEHHSYLSPKGNERLYLTFAF